MLDQTVDDLPCHSKDFLDTLDQYRLTNGLDDLFSTSLPISGVRTIVGEFDTWVRIKIACITDFEGDEIDAAEVSYMLDELNAAMNLRIDLEESSREEEMMMMMVMEGMGEDDTGNDVMEDAGQEAEEEMEEKMLK